MKLFPGHRKDLYLGLFSSTFPSMIYFFSLRRHNFADDNTLSAWGETISKLIDTLESERLLNQTIITKKRNDY